jgi:hypothetical protein
MSPGNRFHFECPLCKHVFAVPSSERSKWGAKARLRMAVCAATDHIIELHRDKLIEMGCRVGMAHHQIVRLVAKWTHRKFVEAMPFELMGLSFHDILPIQALGLKKEDAGC